MRKTWTKGLTALVSFSLDTRANLGFEGFKWDRLLCVGLSVTKLFGTGLNWDDVLIREVL